MKKVYPDPNRHKHSHSLYVHCLDCHTWGISMPSHFLDTDPCGNCRSLQTVKYYPSCCMVAAFEQGQDELYEY
jgi:ribosomal protein S27E